MEDQHAQKTIMRELGSLDRTPLVINWAKALLIDKLNEKRPAHADIFRYEFLTGIDFVFNFDLKYAAMLGVTKAVNHLIQNSEPTQKDKNDALIAASIDGHTQAIETLIKTGAKIEFTNSSLRATPLIIASTRGHSRAVDTLIKAGAKIETKNRDGKTALMEASTWGHTQIIKILLEAGAEIETKDKYNRTPLIIASEAGHERAVEVLLEFGADKDAKTTHGKTAADFALDHGRGRIIEILSRARNTTKKKQNRQNETIINNPVAIIDTQTGG